MSDGAFLHGKTSLVTGGAKGIGRAISLRLAEGGARVAVCGRDRAALDAVAADIRSAGGEALPLCCDLAEEDQILRLFQDVDQAWGDLEILISNAGCFVSALVTETSTKEWDRVLNVNLRGAFLCAREAMKRMASRGGRIINISSVVGLKGYASQGAYTASKHGLLGLTKVMAAEGKENGIVVQAICPGGVDTGMIHDARPDIPTQDLMQPEEIADAVLFMLGQTGNAVTDLLTLRRRKSAAFST